MDTKTAYAKIEPKTEGKSKMGKVTSQKEKKKEASERKKKSGTVEKTQMDGSSKSKMGKVDKTEGGGKSVMRSVMKEPQPKSDGKNTKTNYDLEEKRRKLAADRGSVRVLVKKNLFVSPKKRAEMDHRVCEKHGKVDKQRHIGRVLKLNLFKSANAREATLEKEANELCECLLRANEDANQSKKEKKKKDESKRTKKSN
ncbi:hypothetical protein PFISCL1PPCAC_23848 [Pristionchus fissidentatus]|uniref:Uncharacterized protein n=1 Tax=Pristionchus fissidentatus TaxID=1538716 RepID=A0AAV5WJV8_9BILA|nr:hypothetical protein PFISCL1PPCAC_23848 [Pristionchus fissidentatus]